MHSCSWWLLGATCLTFIHTLGWGSMFFTVVCTPPCVNMPRFIYPSHCERTSSSFPTLDRHERGF